MRLFLSYLYISIFSSILISCNSKELTRSKAKDILQQAVDELPTKDTASAKVSLDNFYLVKEYQSLSLEKEGFWKLNPDVKAEVNVTFTEKAKPYLIGGVTQEGGFFRDSRTSLYQKVMTAQMSIDEVTGIELEPGDRRATVEFKMKATPTPFFQLNKSLEKIQERSLKVHMALYDDGWRIDKSSPIKWH